MVSHIRKAAEEVNGRAQALSGLFGGAYEGMEQQSGEITSMAGAGFQRVQRHSLNIADNMATERLAQEMPSRPVSGARPCKRRRRPWRQVTARAEQHRHCHQHLGQRSQEFWAASSG